MEGRDDCDCDAPRDVKSRSRRSFRRAALAVATGQISVLDCAHRLPAFPAAPEEQKVTHWVISAWRVEAISVPASSPLPSVPWVLSHCRARLGEQTAAGAIDHAVLGGLGSVLGGGKFANGAITAAFAYAAEEYNAETERNASQDAFGKYTSQRSGTFDCGESTCRYGYSTYDLRTGLRGARLLIEYSGSDDVKWIQTFTSTGPGDSGLVQVDCYPGSCPIYPYGTNKQFFDSPGRLYSSGTWVAQTSLVTPNHSGGYGEVTTFSWGFRLTPDSITLLPLHVVQPSTFQTHTIESAHQ
jgi:hypothetical protein